MTLELEHKVRRVFAANCAIADAFDGTLWDACGGGMMASAALAEGALVRDVQFRLDHYHLAECALAAGDDRGAMDKLSDTVKALDGESEWSVKINSDMELVADNGCPKPAKNIILGVLDAMKNSDLKPKKCSFCAAAVRRAAGRRTRPSASPPRAS